MMLYGPAQRRIRPRVREGRRRFDILTIGLHWATVTLLAGMFASAWLLLASDREQAVMLLTLHRSLGVVTWALAIFRLGWRFSYAYLPPFPQTMSKIQQRLAVSVLRRSHDHHRDLRARRDATPSPNWSHDCSPDRQLVTTPKPLLRKFVRLHRCSLAGGCTARSNIQLSPQSRMRPTTRGGVCSPLIGRIDVAHLAQTSHPPSNKSPAPL
jgi:Prokaryotic cytochrome b561